jgi:hypothetical protein
MIDEFKRISGRGFGLIEVLTLNLPGRKPQNTSDRIVGVPVRDSKRALAEYKSAALRLDRLVHLEDIINFRV